LFYDPNFDDWGDKKQLTSDQNAETDITAAFYGDNNLVAIYDRTSPAQPQLNSAKMMGGLSASLSIPAPGTTDLYMLKHTLGGDLAIKTGSFASSLPNPRAGETTTLSGTIVNQGDAAVQNVTVAFYQGDPASGGTQIGSMVIADVLSPGQEREVAINWLVPATGSSLSAYIVVDPSKVLDDADRTNNATSRQFVKPDLTIDLVRWEKAGDNLLSVTARVFNRGSLTSNSTSILFKRDSATGATLSSQTVLALAPGQSTDINFAWDTTGLTASQYLLFISVDDSKSVDEFDETNNTNSLQVEVNAATSSLQFSTANISVSESTGSVTITAVRTGDVASAATVKYATGDSTDVNFRCNPNTAGQPTGIASRKCDYHIASGTLRFAAGETSKQFALSIVDDVYVEGPEVFTLSLSNPVGATLAQNITIPITIIDDDVTGAVNPIDNTRFFVRQLYVDLLSREPDPTGWNGWTTRIDQCGQPGQPPPPCDRVTVAGDGFLRSGEFFDRQFFVLRLYRTGLGRILRYEDVGDLAYVSGFLTTEQLELNKQDLVDEFAARPEFSNRYNPLSNAAFVATLLQVAGVVVPQSIQDDWVLRLDTNQRTRAQVFREISERPEVSARYTHEAQVVSAYYGFFTRNPDGAYLNYLQRLDSGEINLADLANAFINAAEYRQRFGQ
jgi:hypothetical protein